MGSYSKIRNSIKKQYRKIKRQYKKENENPGCDIKNKK